MQRWIDWAEENRGSPKLKQYIKGKANELIDKRIEEQLAKPSLVERYRALVGEHGDAFSGSLFTEEEQAKAMQDGPWIPVTPINNGGAHDDPEYVFDDKDPIRAVKEDKVGRYGTMLDFGKPEDPGEPVVKAHIYSPENCPTKHYNDGTDTCADCGEDLNPPASGIAPGSENVNVLEQPDPRTGLPSWVFGSGGIGKTGIASRTEMLGIEHGFVRTRLEDDLTADEWQDIEDADEELAEFDGPVHLKRSFTLWEASNLPKLMRRRIAAALSRGEGSIVWHD